MSLSWSSCHSCFECSVPFCANISGRRRKSLGSCADTFRKVRLKSNFCESHVAGRIRRKLRRRRFQGHVGLEIHHSRSLMTSSLARLPTPRFPFCSSPLCLFSPTFFSCRLDSSKFRAVTLREGFWQRRVVMEDRLPLQVPCRENPGRAARRMAADDLRCCSAWLLPRVELCISRLCPTFLLLASACKVYADVISVLGSKNISEVHLIPFFFHPFLLLFFFSLPFFLSLFLVKSRYVARLRITVASAVALLNLKMNRQASPHKPVTGTPFRRPEWLSIVIPRGSPTTPCAVASSSGSRY